MKKRIVVLGASGFVGSAIIKHLDVNHYQVIPISRKDCDFADKQSRAVIDAMVKDGDIVVCAAAKAPAKDLGMLTENVAIITNIAEALREKQPAYVLNIGSDAIYGDSMEKLTESSAIEPLNAHGIMHCMREYILERRVEAPIGHLRPTLIYGEGDPHNGYGPNSFLRSAMTHHRIDLFGNGEERRDHIFVGDVARLAVAMIEQKAARAINAVTGSVISFGEIAERIKAAAARQGVTVEIHHKPRSGPMPHNGYRAFSSEAAQALCPGLPFRKLPDYIEETMERTHALQLAQSA